MEANSLRNEFPTKIFSFVKVLPLRQPWGYNESDPATEMNATIFSKLLIHAFGFGCISLGALSFFFEDRHKRAKCLQCLILLQLVEAFFLRVPWVESKEAIDYTADLKKFWLNLSVISGTLMMIGFR